MENLSDKIIFKITTTMDKKDYRKFLYIATFKRNSVVLPLTALLSLVGACFISWVNTARFNFVLIIFFWIFIFALSIGVVCFNVEKKNNKKALSDNLDMFNKANIFCLYDNYLTMDAFAMNSINKFNYKEIHQVLETKEYFIFYFDEHIASLICKRDIENLDAFKIFIKEKLIDKYKNI